MISPNPPNDNDPAPPDASEAPSSVTGLDVIARYWKTLPNSPGVYRMLDSAGDVIYVGKARSLKARVANYTRLAGHTNRIARMILTTHTMEFVTVRTEAEALLLEANLIKRFRPRFNVLMRDDKSFPYIVISRDHPAPQVAKHRGARTRKGDYFGPFASAGAVNRAITMLQRAFLLRTCSDSFYENRTRPCLLFQIKRCSGPCTGEIALPEYQKLADEAVRFLRGESQNVRAMYQKLMADASDKLEFEAAAKYRNRLWALAHVTADQSINPEGVEEADVFAAHQEGGQTCIQVFFFRTGQNWGNRAYYPKADRSLSVEEVLDAFIAQFYDDKPVPRLILLSHEVPNRALLAEALSSKAERKVDIRVPSRGTKSGLVDHALANAREALGRKLAETSSQGRLLEALAERFELARTPRRIEVFDNSHIAGSNAVGAMIVAGPEGFVKGQYRKFNIKSENLTPGDDYAMMREVLTRRFKRLTGEAPSPRERGEVVTSPPPSWGRTGGGESPLSEWGIPPTAPCGIPPTAPFGIPPTAPFGIPPTAPFGVPPTAPFGIPPTPNPSPRGGGELPVLPHEGGGEVRAPQGGEEFTSDLPPEAIADEMSENETGDDETAAGGALPERPDLVLIDGGLGQLSIAREVFAELGITDIALIGVAKGPDRDAGREHFHLPGRDRPLMLEPRDPVLYFVQRLRDEAHRFAIGTHRARRAKALGANPLNDIDGIGPTRKRALLKHFGSAKAVSRAGVEDLKAVDGISSEMAQKIYDYFHERAG